MKKCPACAEDIQDEAVKCRYCGTQLAEMARPAVPELLPARYRTPRFIALAACAALFVGVFLPILRMPVVGSINYFSNGRGDGAILLVLAAVSAGLALKGAYPWLLATGLPSLVLLVVTFLRLRSRIAEMNSSLRTELGDNPFAGLAEAFAQSVQLEFGWAVLVLGSALLILAAVTGRPSAPLPERSGVGMTGWWGFGRPVILTTAVASIAMILLGTTDLLPRAGGSAALGGPTLSQTVASPPEGTDYDFSKTIEIVSVTGRVAPKNTSAERYSNAVVIEPTLRNISGKTIVGIRGTVFVMDGFGRDVGFFIFKDSDKLPSGSQTVGGYQHEDNQFINDEPYDKFAPVVSGGTAKYRVKIREVAFEDGSILPPASK